MIGSTALLATVFFAGAAPPAATTAGATPAVERKVCRTYAETGSLVKKRKVCKTAREWNNAAASARDDLEKMREPVQAQASK